MKNYLQYIKEQKQEKEHIYVCAPSGNFNPDDVEKATKNLQSVGYKVTLSKHALKYYGNTSGTIKERVEDLHEGFFNLDYQLIMAASGGYNSNEILPYVNFNKISNYPKKYIGMSDSTTLCVNLYQKSGIQTYYGKMFSDFINESGAKKANELYKELSHFSIPEGFIIFKEGNMSGRLVGGNLALLCWMLGTPYQLRVKIGDVLFIEDDEETTGNYWQMYLQHLKMAKVFDKISGLIIGSISKGTKFNDLAKIENILEIVLEEYDFPIIFTECFGHIENPIAIPYGVNYQLTV